MYEIGPVTRNNFTVLGIVQVFESRALGNFWSEFTTVPEGTVLSACVLARQKVMQF